MVGIPLLMAAAVAALAAGAELLHARRCRRAAFLAFGPGGRPRAWVRAVPVARAAGLGLVAWGLVVLLQLAPASAAGSGDARAVHHLLVSLDVSPSMTLKDAGPTGKQMRMTRARELLLSILERVDMNQVKVSIVAFYNGAKPVVVDTTDPEVVRNILVDLPMDYAFEAGKTDMYAGVGTAADLCRKWRPGSATLILASDGDTLPARNIPSLPPAVTRALVIGVGNPHRGQHIDGHLSRQDAGALTRLALRLGGVYHDGNAKHVPSPLVKDLSRSLPLLDTGQAGLREWALAAVVVGGGILALLAPILALAGSPWPRRATRPSEKPALKAPATGGGDA